MWKSFGCFGAGGVELKFAKEMGQDQDKNRECAGNRKNNNKANMGVMESGYDDSLEEAMLHAKTSPSGARSNKKRGRHESTDTKTSEMSATLERAPPDGGWGWVVVLAAFLVNMIADGVTFSFGVFYVEFNSYFGESKSKTAWIGSLLASMPLLSGPIASSLADRFGCRRVTIAGSLLSTMGFVLSYYANSVEMLYLTFGVLTGFGLSLCYVAAVVIVAYYFEQRRSLATGLSVCGGGIGTLIFGPLTTKLISSYGWRGTTLIFAGAFLHLSVCGALMRDLEWTKKRVQKAHPPGVDLVPSEISILKKERLCNSAICIPTFVQEQEEQSFLQRTQFRASVNFHSLYNKAKTVTSPTTVSVLYSSPSSDNSSTIVNPSVTSVTNVNHNDSVTHGGGNANPNFVPGSMLKDDGLPWMEASIDTNHLTSIVDSETNLTSPIVSNVTSPLPSQAQTSAPDSLANNACSSWSGIHRHSLTYRGAVLSLKRYRLRPASSCPDIILVANADDRSTHEWKAVIDDVCKWMKGVWEWEHLSNSRFILFILSNLLLYMWYDVPYVYLQDAALQSNYSEAKSSYLISVVGFFNMFGNIMLGYMGDKDWANATVVYGVCMALCGVSIMLIPCLMDWNYWGLAAGCAVFGLTISANYSLTSVILVKVVSLERFANAYGLLLLVQGIGNLLGPPIAGVIYDMTGTNTWSFLVAGGGVLASNVFILAPKVFSCGRK
ncbi:unnamed protein product [Allacma fusca]|uniref:Major facilitator superfamily (MFS) profile domain-containing protein n=1 Tax=Allacma fusca TaxID=39272 RepID=A0A8J2LAH3_9HEXA|nr:unnamed protein product [Allacma fusca]